MRLVHLFENNIRDKEFKLAKDFVRRIKKNCEPWLKQTNFGELIVYRGVDNIDQKIQRKRVRKRRKPRDSKMEWHKLFNDLIAEKGLTANRSNSVFVSGKRDNVYEYGDEFIILPIGNFNYTWHKEIADWWVFWQAREFDIPKYLNGEVPRKLENQVKTYVKQWVDNSEFGKTKINIMQRTKDRIKDLKNKIATSNDKDAIDYYQRQLSLAEEDLEYTERRYLEQLDKAIRLELKRLQYLKPDIRKKVLEGLRGDDGTLQEAIKSGKEIMIKCEYVYYVDELFYKRTILPLLREEKS